MSETKDQIKTLYNKVKRSAPALWAYTTEKQSLIKKYQDRVISNPEIEQLIRNLKIRVFSGNATIATYNRTNNRLVMPAKKRFRWLHGVSREQNYYATLFHEIGHWTGHPNRLNRKTLIKYEKEQCELREEIVAELVSILLCKHFNICRKPLKYSLRYINLYLSRITGDKEAAFRRCYSHAIKATKYILERVNVR